MGIKHQQDSKDLSFRGSNLSEVSLLSFLFQDLLVNILLPVAQHFHITREHLFPLYIVKNLLQIRNLRGALARMAEFV